ncbi:sporulation protein YqfC [Virgibacillus sp. W0430]|uniref:sporulation protein YqfC n=1 Tax=Virgibacillus sp. W0430 TaxID=3391580 RepID=UPI003F4721DC
MKKWRHRLHPILTKYFALPSDVVLELPRLTLIGQIHLYIENHQGLIVYSDTELKLKTFDGFVQIIGEGFIIKMMLPEEILLEGTIKEVKYIQR